MANNDELKVRPEKPSNNRGSKRVEIACTGKMTDDMKQNTSNHPLNNSASKTNAIQAPLDLFSDSDSGQESDISSEAKDKSTDVMVSSQNAERFYVFKKFPLEIQCKIWQEALPKTSQIVQVGRLMVASGSVPNATTMLVRDAATGRMRDLGFEFTIKCPAIISPFMHICRSSRLAARMALAQTPTFATQIGHPILFNFKRDILYLQSTEAMEIFVKMSEHEGLTQAHLESVKRLAVTFNSGEVENLILCQVLATFPRLSELYIAVDPAGFGRQNKLPLNDQRPKINSWTEIIRMVAFDMGVKCSNWTPPTCKWVLKSHLDSLLL